MGGYFMKRSTGAALLGAAVLAFSPVAKADELSDLKAQVQIMQQQQQQLQQQLQKLNERLEAQSAVPKAAPVAAAPAPVPAGAAVTTAAAAPAPAAPLAPGEHGFLEHKAGDDLTFYTPGGQITAYGNVDVSVDATTKGLSASSGAVGRVGWQPDISTNISYFGIRGAQALPGASFGFVYQFETQIDIAATSGTGETNSSQSNQVKGGLTSRNSFIGLDSPSWGAIKIGKTDAPYKLSTASFNPFSGMVGDYQVIMANTGGDNRVEFGTRLDHSIWYESPKLSGFSMAALFSPGQNRASNSDNIAAGESDCTGGNIPGSGGIVPVSCSDGSFSDAVSASVTYEGGPVKLVAAYERHMKVNRSSDITGLYGSGNAYSQLLQSQDVADEDAAKFGAQYFYAKGSNVGVIFESLHRYVPSDLAFQNERQRYGTWFTISQQLTDDMSVHFGWAHAFRAPGDPGQHNDSVNLPPGGVPGLDATAGANSDNTSNLLTAALKYKLGTNLTLYTDFAATINGPAAHYDLGAGGRSVTTDCHDASDATGGLVASNPHCYTGVTLMGTSIGLASKF